MLTGKRAHTLGELLDLVRTCSGSSIFNHTFSAFRQLREARTPYNSDFAMWVYKSLGESALAEMIMAMDFREHFGVESLREKLVEIIGGYRSFKPAAFLKRAEEPFYLHDVQRFVYLTDKFSYDLRSFREVLPTISHSSLYYHFIESRLETMLEADAFSNWIENSLGLRDLAARIKRIDIYAYTLEGMRAEIMNTIDDFLEKRG